MEILINHSFTSSNEIRFILKSIWKPKLVAEECRKKLKQKLILAGRSSVDCKFNDLKKCQINVIPPKLKLIENLFPFTAATICTLGKS